VHADVKSCINDGRRILHPAVFDHLLSNKNAQHNPLLQERPYCASDTRYIASPSEAFKRVVRSVDSGIIFWHPASYDALSLWATKKVCFYQRQGKGREA
jgi:hypothetical protein